jgi:hypothetical protein
VFLGVDVLVERVQTPPPAAATAGSTLEDVGEDAGEM